MKSRWVMASICAVLAVVALAAPAAAQEAPPNPDDPSCPIGVGDPPALGNVPAAFGAVDLDGDGVAYNEGDHEAAASLDESERESWESAVAALNEWTRELKHVCQDDNLRRWASAHLAGLPLFLWGIPGQGVAGDIADVPGDLADTVTGPVRDLAQGWVQDALDELAREVVEVAGTLTGYVSEELARTGVPVLEADWYQEHYNRAIGWAGLLMLPLALFAIGSAVARGDSTRAAHTMLQVPAAFFLAVVAVWIVGATSGISTAVARSLVPDIQGSAQGMLTDPNALGVGVSILVWGLAALAALATVVWLLLAEAATYGLVLFLPLAFAGRVWPPAAAWGRKLFATALAIVVSKAVIFGLWAVAMDGLEQTADGAVPLRSALALVATLVMAAFAPLVLLRMLPMLNGVEGVPSTGRAARAALTMAHEGGSTVSMIRSGSGGGRRQGGFAAAAGGGGGGGGGGVAAGSLGVTSHIAGMAPRIPPGVRHDKGRKPPPKDEAK